MNIYRKTSFSTNHPALCSDLSHITLRLKMRPLNFKMNRWHVQTESFEK